MKLKKLLIDLEAQLLKENASILKYFNQGISDIEIINLFQKIGLTPSEELIELFEWKNGINYDAIPTGMLNIGFNGVFMPLEECILYYQELIYEAEIEKFYFPFFSDDTLLINLDTNSEFYNMIYLYSPSLLILEPTTYFDSLHQMFETFKICFQNGIFKYTSEGYFEYELERAWELSREVNQKSIYWKNRHI